ncbi:sel1 repeat family protein [Shewanella sp. A3A]|nr:sel1 repeat family protein [Shewanella ferrihydritica]
MKRWALRVFAVMLLLLFVASGLLLMQPAGNRLQQLQWQDFYVLSADKQLALAQQYYAKNSAQFSVKLAEKWFVRAAKNGEQEAHYQLAHLYYVYPYISGLGWEANVTMATDELEQAADAGMLKAQTELADILFKHNNKADKIRGLDYLARAADQQDIKAMLQLGQRYCTDSDIVNHELGQSYFELAANAGDQRAPLILASLFRQGTCGPANNDRYYYWVEKAANAGIAEAQQWLADIYLQGEGRPVDQLKGALLLYRSAQADALYKLGVLLQQQSALFPQLQAQVTDGFILDNDYIGTIATCFYNAAQQGHPKAAFAYGLLNLQHNDRDMALQAFAIARDAGYPKYAADLGDVQAKLDMASIKAEGLSGFFGW